MIVSILLGVNLVLSARIGVIPGAFAMLHPMHEPSVLESQHRSAALNQKLTRAIHADDYETAKDLLLKGADPNARDGENSSTMLQHVHPRKGERIVALLLASGADPNLRDRFGSTAVMRYAASAHPMIGGNHPTWEQSRRCIELLVLNGADLDMRDKDGHDVVDLVKMAPDATNDLLRLKVISKRIRARVVDPRVQTSGVQAALANLRH